MDRAQIKARAKQIIGENRRLVIGAAAVTSLLTGILTWIATQAVGGKSSLEILNGAWQLNYSDLDAMQGYLRESGSSNFLSIIIWLLTYPIARAWIGYCMRAWRGEVGGQAYVLGGYRQPYLWSSIASGLLMGLRVLLWMIPLFVTLFIPSMLMMGDGMQELSFFLLVVWAVAFAVWWIIITYRYEIMPYLLWDKPKMGAARALGLSVRLMKGNIWRMVVLELSFFGWLLLLGVITGGAEAILLSFGVAGSLLSTLISALIFSVLRAYVDISTAGMVAQIRQEALDSGRVAEADFE